MRERIASGHGLMLFELIIAIGFFAVFAAVFLNITFSARQTSLDSNNLSHAVVAAENAAECFKAGVEPPLYFDENWQPTQETAPAFTISTALGTQSGVVTAEISVLDRSGAVLYRLTAKKLGEKTP